MSVLRSVLAAQALITILPLIFVGGILAQENGRLELKTVLPSEGQRSPVANFELTLSQTEADSSLVELIVDATIADGWHIYPMNSKGLNIPTSISLESSGLEPIDHSFQLKSKSALRKKLKGKFSWSRTYKITEEATPWSAKGNIRFQACDANKCLPPTTLKFEFDSSNAAEVSLDEASDAQVIKLATEECKATRPPAKFEMASLFAGRRNDQLNRKCSIEVDGEKIDIYLPEEKELTTENTGHENTMVSNTATYISIDQNGDGTLAAHEAQPTNLPIRILDSMFEVVDIAKDASSISLVPHEGPLSGTVLNRRCPEFSFQTVDGDRTISDKSILGKVTLLDIWAVT